MAVIRNRITATPPPGETVSVDILESAVSVGTAYAERKGSRTLTLPLTITDRTNFFLPDGGGPYTVSVKLDGVEIAGSDGATVTASTFPTEVGATVDTSEQTALASVYDNTTSGLTATNVQAALDEIVTRVVALETP